MSNKYVFIFTLLCDAESDWWQAMEAPLSETEYESDLAPNVKGF